MKRRIHLAETTVPHLTRFLSAFLALVLLVTIGCASRQNINVKSEGLPEDHAMGQAKAEPESPDSIDGELDSLAPYPPDEEVSESPLSGDQFDESPMVPALTGELDEGPPSSKKEASPPAETSDIPPVAPLPAIKEEPVDLSNVPTTLTDIFFDYDQYRIRQDAITDLETNAKVLTLRYPNKKVIIQGHCDERGTREYNLILGERRALAVKNYLMDLGVPAKNMQIISYGKEKPFCIEHSKKCWQKNRRSHFVIN